MFPTSGYFKSIPCPYFNKSVCERPNCHFKHQKASSSDRRNHLIPSYTSFKPGQSCSFSRATTSTAADGAYKPIPKVKKSAYRSAALPRPHYQHEPFPTGPSTLVYKPTPISELNKFHPCPQKDTQQTADAVINAEFQVIGQSNSRPDTAADHNSSHEAAGFHVVNGQGDGNGSVTSDNLPSLEIDLDVPVDEDVFDSSPAVEEDNEELVTPPDNGNDGNESETLPQETVEDTKNKITEVPVPVTITKRSVSRKELEEFTDLFGEASDDEVVDEDCTRAAAEDEEVVEVAVSRCEQPVIDLTVDSSSDEEQSNHQVEPVKIREEKPQNKTIKSETSHPVKHKSKHKRDGKESERSNDDYDELASFNKGATPIIVSSAGDSDQCKELFEMFKNDVPGGHETFGDSAMQVSQDIPDAIESSRKRQAREGSESLSKQPVKKRITAPNAQQVMHKRYEAMKQANLHKKQQETTPPSNSISQVEQKPDYNSIPGVTSSRTYKGLARTAHQPTSKKVKRSLERPRIAVDSKSKVPTGVRQLKLNIIIEECLKLYPEEPDAYTRAKSEEEAACSRAGNRIIYTNLVANIIKKIRDEIGSGSCDKSQSKVSHESVIAGKSASSFTVGLKRKTSVNMTKKDMCGELLFKKLRSYLLSEAQLVDQGYPRSDWGNPGHAVIQWSHYDKPPQNKGNIRTCRRCGKNFRLSDDGEYINKEECVYHWGKVFQSRVHGTLDMHFSCCEGKPGTEGCTMCNGHVHDTNKYEDLTGYMKTFAKTERDYCGVYALDCEMVYTVRGLEIARVTVINDELSVMLDSLIKPESEIIDYNTRFSGLTADNFRNVDTTLKDVQAILLNMFQENTVLIGHSLNSDLIALKLIHDNVVDTSLVWPHKHGLPYKRALKSLMLDILNKLIQESGSAGHDSSEDAEACMLLMKWKVFQDYMKDNR